MSRATTDDDYTAVQTGIWLIFLAHPLFLLVVRDMPLWQQVAGTILVVITGWAYLRAHRVRLADDDNLNGIAWLTALVIPLAGLSTLIGAWAATLLPYITSVAAALMSARSSIIANALIIGGYGIFVLATQDLPTLIFFGVSATLSLVVGVQVRTERSIGERRNLAAELELSRQRETIYRDVHDLLGHSLTVINVKSSLARKLVDVDKQRAAQELDEIIELSRSSLEDIRRAVRTTYAPTLQHELEAARSALSAAGIETTITEDTHSDSPLFGWVVREAVTNVIRHSQATECEITVSPGRLVVADNGVGLPSGVRLRSITDRVQAAGGEVSVSSVNGTRIEVTA